MISMPTILRLQALFTMSFADVVKQIKKVMQTTIGTTWTKTTAI